jgi:hypothetical protein
MTENDKNLERLKRVDFETVWTGERRGEFTAWLAKQKNLDLLGESIGFDLQVEETGLDLSGGEIICHDAQSGPILIFDQTGGGNDAYFARLLRRAAAEGAVTVVWVTDELPDNDRQILDWLNKITQKEVCFFGVEVELWSIGGSNPAPRFNVACRPLKSGQND